MEVENIKKGLIYILSDKKGLCYMGGTTDFQNLQSIISSYKSKIKQRLRQRKMGIYHLKNECVALLDLDFQYEIIEDDIATDKLQWRKHYWYDNYKMKKGFKMVSSRNL